MTCQGYGIPHNHKHYDAIAAASKAAGNGMMLGNYYTNQKIAESGRFPKGYELKPKDNYGLESLAENYQDQKIKHRDLKVEANGLQKKIMQELSKLKKEDVNMN